MARILLIETATRLCSVAIAEDHTVLASRDEESERPSHAEKLNVFVEQVLHESATSMARIDAVAVGIGPGSYTGLRIGLSAAKGFCFSLGKPIIGIGTLDTLVSELIGSGIDLQAGQPLLPMIDARRMEVFMQECAIDGAVVRGAYPQVLDEAWIATLPKGVRPVVFGDGADKAVALFKGRAELMHVPHVRSRAAAMAGIAFDRYRSHSFDDVAYLVPTYGKEANVTQAK